MGTAYPALCTSDSKSFAHPIPMSETSVFRTYIFIVRSTPTDAPQKLLVSIRFHPVHRYSNLIDGIVTYCTWCYSVSPAGDPVRSSKVHSPSSRLLLIH